VSCTLQVIKGEYSKEIQTAAEQMAGQMDKYVSGFIRRFEEGYVKLEQTIRKTVHWTRSKGKKAGKAKLQAA
jgi:hypothetical protein